MSASLASVATTHPATTGVRARYSGILRGELFKVLHMRITWVLVALDVVFIIGSQLILAAGPETRNQLRNDSLGAFYNVMQGDLSLLRIFGGIIMLVLAAHVVGLEYQLGTIRILLGRGVGRLQLLGAKVVALALVALAVLGIGLLIELAFAWGLALALAGGQQPFKALNAEYWVNLRLYLLCVVISLGVTLLLGVAAAVVGRSLSFGLAAGLSWFAVDNMATIPLTLLYQFTHSDFWLKVSGVLLGPLLNRLPDHVVRAYHVTVQGAHGAVTIAKPVFGFGVIPLVRIDETHALTVIGIYALIFAATAIALTWRRDVLE